jgi:hypothetical protein
VAAADGAVVPSSLQVLSDGNVAVPGDLQVGGAIISNMRVNDTIVDLAVHNPGDALTAGLVVESDAGTAFSGLVRSGGDTHEFVLFDKAPTRPLPHTSPPPANGVLNLGTLQASSSVTASNVAATNRADIDARVLRSTLSAKGALLAASAPGTPIAVPPADQDNMQLRSSANAASGMEWYTPPTCIQESQYATKGTILAGSGTGAPLALPLGVPGTVLTADATGGVAWSAPTVTDTSCTPIPGVTAQTTMQGLCTEVASKVRHLVSTTEVSTTWKGDLIVEGGMSSTLQYFTNDKAPVVSRTTGAPARMVGVYFTVDIPILVTNFMLHQEVLDRPVIMWHGGGSAAGNVVIPATTGHTNVLQNGYVVGESFRIPVWLNPGTYLVAYTLPVGVGHIYNPPMKPQSIFTNVQQMLHNTNDLEYPKNPPNIYAEVVKNLVMFAYRVIDPPTVQMPLTAVSTVNAKGKPGQMRWGLDADVAYVYVCIAVNTWRRTALAAW